MTTLNESDPFPLDEMFSFLEKLNLSTRRTSYSPSHCYESPTVELISGKAAQTGLLLLYSLTCLASLTGNGLTLLVHLLCRRRGQRRQAAKMRSYLSSLAVADLLLGLLSATFTYVTLILRHWPFPPWLCPLAQFAQLVASFVTSLTLALIALERYLVVFHAPSPACRWAARHSGHLIGATWCLGSLYAYLPSRHLRTSTFLHGVTLYEQCSLTLEHPTPRTLSLFRVLNLLTFLLPLGAILFTYGVIMRRLGRENNHFIVKYVSSGPKDEEDDSWIRIVLPSEVADAQATHQILTIEQRSKTIQMLRIIILAYVISWSPIKVFQFLHSNGTLGLACSELSFYALNYAYLVCHWLAMANCTVNPIIFSFMSKSFRNDLCRLFLLLGSKLSLIKRQETGASELSLIETIDC